MSSRLILLAPVLMSCAFAGDNGIRPRPAASDYPDHKTAGGIELAAVVIRPERAAKLFATDLSKAGYIAVEVAVYPEPGNQANLQSRDFLLRVGSEPATLRPVSPDTVVGVVQKQHIPRVPTNHDVTVYSSETIGYETGNGHGHVYTASGVGVAVGPQPTPPPPPGSSPADRDVMRQELSDKALPEGKTSDPVAGYLYFPKPKSMNGTFHLTYYGSPTEIRLDLPGPKK
jgi:hypothetical protein